MPTVCLIDADWFRVFYRECFTEKTRPQRSKEQRRRDCARRQLGRLIEAARCSVNALTGPAGPRKRPAGVDKMLMRLNFRRRAVNGWRWWATREEWVKHDPRLFPSGGIAAAGRRVRL